MGSAVVLTLCYAEVEGGGGRLYEGHVDMETINGCKYRVLFTVVKSVSLIVKRRAKPKAI